MMLCTKDNPGGATFTPETLMLNMQKLFRCIKRHRKATGPARLAVDAWFFSESTALALLPDVEVVMSARNTGPKSIWALLEKDLHKGQYLVLVKGKLVALAYGDNGVIRNLSTCTQVTPEALTREEQTTLQVEDRGLARGQCIANICRELNHYNDSQLAGLLRMMGLRLIGPYQTATPLYLPRPDDERTTLGRHQDTTLARALEEATSTSSATGDPEQHRKKKKKELTLEQAIVLTCNSTVQELSGLTKAQLLSLGKPLGLRQSLDKTGLIDGILARQHRDIAQDKIRAHAFLTMPRKCAAGTPPPPPVELYRRLFNSVDKFNAGICHLNPPHRHRHRNTVLLEWLVRVMCQFLHAAYKEHYALQGQVPPWDNIKSFAAALAKDIADHRGRYLGARIVELCDEVRHQGPPPTKRAKSATCVIDRSGPVTRGAEIEDARRRKVG